MRNSRFEGIEIDPPDTPEAVVIWLHGLGADGSDFQPLVPLLRLPRRPAVRFVFPHAPMRPVTINFGMVMRAWYDIEDTDLTRKVDRSHFLESSENLAAMIDRERSDGIDPSRILLAGFSQGGAIALHTGIVYPERLAGILALSTYLPTEPTIAKEADPSNRDIPILMMHGLDDPVIPIQEALKARNTLRGLNYDVAWRTYPMAHEVCAEQIPDIRSWMLEALQRSGETNSRAKASPAG